MGCSPNEKLLYEEKSLGKIYTVDAPKNCQWNIGLLTEQLKTLTSAVNDEKLPPIRTIFHPKHTFVKQHTKGTILLVQAEKGRWIVPIESDFFFFQQGDEVIGYEYPKDYRLQCNN